MLKIATTLVLLAACCAAPAAHAQGPAPARDMNVISEAEVRASSTRDLYELVQSVRPHWLTRQKQHSFFRTAELLVFMDGARIGNVRALREIATAQVHSLRFLTTAEVHERFHRNAPNGAIMVLTGPEADRAPRASADAPWRGRDADDFASVQVSGGSLRLGMRGDMAPEFNRGQTFAVGFLLPFAPDAFLRFTYLHQAGVVLTPGPGSVNAPRQEGSLGGFNVELKGQLPETARFTPYVTGGIAMLWLGGGIPPTFDFGYVVSGGLDVHVTGPLHAFVEAGHTSTSGEYSLSAQPLRIGATVTFGRP